MKAATPRLPGYLPLPALAVGSALLLFLQLASGTNAIFSLYIFIFVWLFGLTLNELGGLRTVCGIAVAAMALKTVVISQIVKIVLWQPADSNLLAPLQTALVMVVGMTGVMIAAFLARPLTFRRELLRPVSDPRVLLMLCVVATGVGILVQIGLRLAPEGSTVGRMTTGIVQYMQIFMPMGTVAGTAYVLMRTQRQRCFGLPVLIPMLTQLTFGALIASKQVMYEPIFAHILTCLAFGFRYRFKHLPVGVAIAAVCAFVLYPLSQLGRGVFRAQGWVENITLFADFVTSNMSDLAGLQGLVNTVSELEGQTPSLDLYYGRPLGIIDRFSLITPADRLISETLRSGHSGIDFMISSIEFLPRSITGAPPAFSPGNFLGKKTGIISGDDDITAIAFGPFAEAFHTFEIVGVLLVIGCAFFAYFTVQKLVCNNLEYSVWPLIMAVSVQHYFAESSVAGIIFYIVRTLPFVWVLSHAVMPTCALLAKLLSSNRQSPPNDRLSATPMEVQRERSA